LVRFSCYNCFVVRKATLTLNTDPPATPTSSDPSPSPSSTPTSRTLVRDMTFEQGSLTGPDAADSIKGTVRLEKRQYWLLPRCINCLWIELNPKYNLLFT
jgi:hypothetical protein